MHSEAWFHRVKAAQRDLIKLVGGIERAAEISSVSTSQIGRMNNVRDTDLMTISVVYALESECGVPIVTQAMAELNGRRLSDPDAEQRANLDVIMASAEMMQRFGSLIATTGRAIADGFVTPTEAIPIDRELANIERVIPGFRQALAAIIASGGGKAELRVVAGEG